MSPFRAWTGDAGPSPKRRTGTSTPARPDTGVIEPTGRREKSNIDINTDIKPTYFERLPHPPPATVERIDQPDFIFERW
jgi:hypothetical protein